MDRTKRAIFLAVLAAACYGVSAPLSKVLLYSLSPTFTAALLYLGAGAGMSVLGALKGARMQEARVTKQELPYIVGMVALDIAAPILLMVGLTMTAPANASLINNFEIVVTTLIAMLIFREAVGKRMWAAIVLITLSSILLTFDGGEGVAFSAGSIFVILACLCWGLENNCTRMLSLKDPLQIVVIKGLGSGAGALLIALCRREITLNVSAIILALLLGFVAYGLSITFYIYAQRQLGAARTSAYYAVAPFIGVALSFAVFRQPVSPSFVVALLLMVGGAYLAAFERHEHAHVHEAVTHEHRHNHSDGHHNHPHEVPVTGEHSHNHSHELINHAHKHTPDLHHTHQHV